MKQVVQDVRSGLTAVRDIPAPAAQAGQVLVATAASLISAGTERYVVELARKSLIGKARARPDQVLRVLKKLKEDGVLTTVQQVRAKLDEPMPLGYSAAGVVLTAGAGVTEWRPGDRVAMAAPHAAVVSVGRNLVARVPDGVTFEQAAYTSVSAIAVEGVRLARVGLGDRVLVIGLGLIGQIAVCLLRAQGCRVFGTDVDAGRADLARSLGAHATGLGSPLAEARSFTGQQGFDAVIITAATPSNAPIELAADVARTRGRIVLVGVVGLDLPRRPFYDKELEFTVSSSLGPGRNDPAYEERGRDYPFGHVRWTAQRNMQAALDLMADGKLPVERLTTHRFAIVEAARAYDLVTGGGAAAPLGIVLSYPEAHGSPARRVEIGSRPAAAPSGDLGVSLIGAGNFARLMMIPALARQGGFTWRGACTAKGMSAESTGRHSGFAFATTDPEEVFADPNTHAVLIATRHDQHAALAVAALRAGKHVFVEKPLCITRAELAAIEACLVDLGARAPILAVGHNRRFAPATAEVRAFFAGVGPVTVAHRFVPGPVPAGHWTQDEDVGGGRVIGEACHAIDTCTAIVGSPPVRVFAEAARGESGVAHDDRVFITLRHQNGAVSSISYQADGDRGVGAERIEAFGGGRTAVVDAWERIELAEGGKVRHESGGKDKGHDAQFGTFLRACRGGITWPVPWPELRAVTWASLLAVASLRDGLPHACDGDLAAEDQGEDHGSDAPAP